MKLTRLLGAMAAVAVLSLAAAPASAFEWPFANFQWNPQAFDYAACLTKHAKSYCDAAASTKSISDAGPGAGAGLPQ